MSIILTEVGKASRPCKAYFGDDDAPGEPLNFVYDPSRYTPLLEQKTQEAFNDRMLGLMYASMIDGVVLSWDAKDVHPDDAAKISAGKLSRDKARLVDFPPTTENIARIPIKALVKIVDAMQADQRPTGEASGDSSGSFGTGAE